MLCDYVERIDEILAPTMISNSLARDFTEDIFHHILIIHHKSFQNTILCALLDYFTV